MGKLQLIQLQKESIYSKETPLREKSLIVFDFGDDFQKEVDDLLDTFYGWKIAVGISAPQVGIKKRLAIINADKANPDDTLIIVNPVIQFESGKKDKKKESCLSLPNIRGEVERRYKIHLNYQDRHGIKKELIAEGFLARIIMHEIDHLDGILFVDRMNSDVGIEPLDSVWE